MPKMDKKQLQEQIDNIKKTNNNGGWSTGDVSKGLAQIFFFIWTLILFIQQYALSPFPNFHYIFQLSFSGFVNLI